VTGLSRRSLLVAAAAAPAAARGAATGDATSSALPAVAAPQDEDAWARIAAHYDVEPGIVNVENGNWGVMARPVLDAYLEHTRRVNHGNSYYARRRYWQDYRDVLEMTAPRLGARPDEIALTRGATEALKGLIGGYRLAPGSAVMYADLDYGAMQSCMDSLAARHGGRVVRLAIPEPADHDGLIDFYRQALDVHADTRLLLLTHLSHRTGLVLPVREIVRAARQRGVDVIVDAAHSWGQLDFDVTDLDADFVGFNLHKWLGAPIGVGVMYVRRSRLDAIEPDIAASAVEWDRIDGRVHSGTSNFAAFLTVPDAFAFHDAIGGSAAKAARLKYLRQRWIAGVSRVAGVTLLTPTDERLHGGITSFRINGLHGVADNRAIAQRLLDEHRVFTVHRDGVAHGACVRVTPGLYNSADDLDRVGRAIQAVAATAQVG
jgi:selenocysteine lyase/cysteine desulfurase